MEYCIIVTMFNRKFNFLHGSILHLLIKRWEFIWKECFTRNFQLNIWNINLEKSEISQQNFHRGPRKLSYYTAFTRNSKILWSKIKRWKKVLFERTTWSNEEDDKKKKFWIASSINGDVERHAEIILRDDKWKDSIWTRPKILTPLTRVNPVATLSPPQLLVDINHALNRGRGKG